MAGHPFIADEGREREIPRIEQIYAEKVADLIRGVPEVVERRFGRTVHDGLNTLPEQHNHA